MGKIKRLQIHLNGKGFEKLKKSNVAASMLEDAAKQMIKEAILTNSETMQIALTFRDKKLGNWNFVAILVRAQIKKKGK